MIFIFGKLLHYEKSCDIIVELDMRRCERLPIGETEPFGGIFTEYVRESGEAFINAESVFGRRARSWRSAPFFSGETRNTRHGVESVEPRFTASRRSFPTYNRGARARNLKGGKKQWQ